MKTHHSHGRNGFTSCKFCDELLTDDNPGKIAKRIRGGNIYKEVICNTCLESDPYYDLDCDELNDYPNEYDII